MNTERSRLKWRCRRGVKELDIIFEKYLSEHYDNADAKEQLAFSQLLKLEDPPLLSMLIGSADPKDTQQLILVKKLRHIVF